MRYLTRDKSRSRTALGYKTLKDWPLDLQLLWQMTAGTALFLVTLVGLLLRPVRAYAGLARR